MPRWALYVLCGKNSAFSFGRFLFLPGVCLNCLGMKRAMIIKGDGELAAPTCPPTAWQRRLKPVEIVVGRTQSHQSNRFFSSIGFCFRTWHSTDNGGEPKKMPVSRGFPKN
jgi:hypothetical protein